MTIGGGISDYIDAPREAGRSLAPCLKNAEENVPAELRKRTPIYLGATAGMRLIE